MAAKDLDISDIKKRVQDDLEGITICCICTEVYTDPKSLSCIHTFCMKCIQETGLKCGKGPGDEMPCPLCRRLFKIPPEGFPGLPKNFFIDRLIQQVLKLSNRSTVSTAVCSLCLKESNEQTSNETPAAEIYCVDCKHSLCENCRSEHRKYKLNKNHNLIPIDEYESGPKVMAELDPLVCEVHEQKALDVYCVDCKSVVCAICFIEEHRHHEGSYVNNCVDGFRRQIENNTASLNACISQVQMKKLDILTVKEAIDKRAERLECDVQRRTAEIKQIADEHGSRLLQGLCSDRQSRLKEIQMITDDIDTYQVILESYNSYCKEIMIKGAAGDICRAVSDLSSRAIELEQQCQPIMDRIIQDFNFCFRESELEELLKKGCVNLVGKIEEDSDPKPKESSKQGQFDSKTANVSIQTNRFEEEFEKYKMNVEKLRKKIEKMEADDLRNKYKSDPVLVYTFKTITLKKKNWNIFGFSIRGKSSKEDDVAPFIGMTILGKELFVLVASSSEVEVHDSITFNFSRRLKVKELNFPLDIASCSRNKCLYIFHYTPRDASGEILRIDPHGKVINKWSTGVDWGLSLSVTSESNVILAINEKHKLNEYSADGQLIREINLSEAGIFSPLNAIKLANGDFVVSHGGFYHDDAYGVHRVCIADADGKLKKSFGGKRGASIGQLDGPTSLSVDGNGFVMVADCGNSRVLLLNSDLEFKREFLSKEKHGLLNPLRIFVDESMDRLFVVNYLPNSEIWIVVLYCK